MTTVTVLHASPKPIQTMMIHHRSLLYITIMQVCLSCLSVSLVPSVWHSHRPRLQHFGPWALGRCPPLSPMGSLRKVELSWRVME